MIDVVEVVDLVEQMDALILKKNGKNNVSFDVCIIFAGFQFLGLKKRKRLHVIKKILTL